MVVDFHAHYFPDKIAGDAIRKLSVPGFEAFTDGTRAGLERSMEAAGIDISVNMPVATSAEQVDKINSWAAANSRHPILSFGAIHPKSEDPAGICRRLRDSGIKGVKMHPEYQDFSPEDTSLDGIWESCVEYGLLILFHAGADLGFSPPYRSDPAKFAALHRRFPGLRMILAHFGSWRMWNEVERHIAGLPVYLETSFTSGFIAAEDMERIIRKHGADRILFGTDSPWRDQKTELEAFKTLRICETDKKKILAGNALALLGL